MAYRHRDPYSSRNLRLNSLPVSVRGSVSRKSMLRGLSSLRGKVSGRRFLDARRGETSPRPNTAKQAPVDEPGAPGAAPSSSLVALMGDVAPAATASVREFGAERLDDDASSTRVEGRRRSIHFLRYSSVM